MLDDAAQSLTARLSTGFGAEKLDLLTMNYGTEDGGAPPYLHTPLRAFAADDLSFPIENIDDIVILEEFT